jgi:hypothetical protein
LAAAFKQLEMLSHETQLKRVPLTVYHAARQSPSSGQSMQNCMAQLPYPVRAEQSAASAREGMSAAATAAAACRADETMRRLAANRAGEFMC